MGISQKIKSDLDYQIEHIKEADIETIIKILWYLWASFWVILKYIGINIAYKADSQVGFICIADDVKFQVPLILWIWNNVWTQYQISWLWISRSSDEQVMIFPGVQFSDVVRNQTNIIWIQVAGIVEEQIQLGGLQITWGFQKKQEQWAWLQSAWKKGDEQEQWFWNTTIKKWIKKKISTS